MAKNSNKNDMSLIRDGLYLALKNKDFDILEEVQRLLQYGDVSDTDKLRALVAMFKYIFPTLKTQEITVSNVNDMKVTEDRQAAQKFVDMVNGDLFNDIIKSN